MGSRQPKITIPKSLRKPSTGEESSEAVQYSLQQINTDLARILTLLRTRTPAFTYPTVTQTPLRAEQVTQPFPDAIRGSRVTPVYPEGSLGSQGQIPYQSGSVTEPYHVRGAGVPVLPTGVPVLPTQGPVLPGRQGQTQTL